MNSIIITWNVCKRTLGNFKGFLLLIVLPVLVISAIISIFGSPSTASPKIAFVNADKGALGQHLLNGLDAFDQYELTELTNEDDVIKQVMLNEVAAGFVIADDFSNRMERDDHRTPFDVITFYQLNQTEQTIAIEIMLEREAARIGSALALAKEQNEAALKQTDLTDLTAFVQALLAMQEKHNVRAQINDKFELNPFFTTIIGTMLLFIMILVNSAIHNIVETRVNRTMARIYTAPIRAFEIMVGNFLGSFIIGTLQISLILLFTVYALGFDYGVPLFTLFIILQCFLLSAIGIACAVSGLVRNINMLRNVNLLVIVPTCMIGGCFWPIWIMPDAMQKLANFTPQKWAIEAIERMAFGGTYPEISWHLAILCLFALILLTFGSYVLRPSEAAQT